MAKDVGRVPSGILIGDQRKDSILLVQDIDGDGSGAGNSETTVFLDDKNASGLESPTGNVFTLHQASDKSVYFGDGGSDAVYRLRDLNGDGDAQDADEAKVWFSAANLAGLSTVTPNGVHEGADGAIYIANAGTTSAPQDAIYRTVDLNGDGDANDIGEATVWLDVQTIVDTAVPFDLSFDGDIAYLSDLAGGATDVIYRIEDGDGDGAIEENEVVAYVTDDMSFGAPVDIANAVGMDGALYTLTLLPDVGEIVRLYRLTDLDGSGRIDAASEAVEVWNGEAMPDGFAIDIGFSLSADEDGRLALTANTFAGEGNVVELTDRNGDGDYLDAGETIVFASSGFDGQLDRPRAVEFYEGAPSPAATTVGAGNHFSVFLDQKTNTLYTSGENVVGQLGIGTTGFDVKTTVEVDLPEAFDVTITSVSAGLLHTTFLTDDGDVYAFGFNNNGALGLGDEDTRTEAVLVETLDDVNVVGIVNGNGASYAIADDGRLYAWGSNSNGQLGLGDREERLTPTIVEALSGETAVDVSAGTSHTLVLTADGQVYGFGSNRDGQLGAPDGLDADGTPLRRVESPVLVEGLPDNVVSVTADTLTSFAVTADGRLFGWGESRTGQLLRGADNGDGTFTADPSDVLSPVELTGIPGNVVDVKAGARWVMALTADGDVYGWGPNDVGPTGGLDGDPAAESDAIFFPTLIAELDDLNIVELQSGPNSIIAVCDTGEIFTWGSNPDGRLGFASDGSVYTPQQIELGGPADPFLVSATPGDNDRDVSNDTVLKLEFTEDVFAGTGMLTLFDRDTGQRTEIDVTDQRLVDFHGSIVSVTPPEHLNTDTRYAVEIEEGAFVDANGNAYEGIDAGDTSTFNFSTSEIEAPSPDDLKGGFRDDLIRGGSQGDHIRGRLGDDILSGGGGDDRIFAGWGDDFVLGGDGDDRLFGSLGRDDLSGGQGDDDLRGGWGKDTLSGGAGDDDMRGGWGTDTFIFDGGHDTIYDFDTGFEFWFLSRPTETLVFDIDGLDSFETLIETASQAGRDVVFDVGDQDSLTLRDVQLSHLDADVFDFV